MSFLSHSRDGRFVNSKVISASLGNGLTPTASTSSSIVVALKHLRTFNVSSPACAHWDLAADRWDTQGCRVEASNRTHTICRCATLGNFALLMREGGSDSVPDMAPFLHGEESSSSPSLAAPGTKLYTHVYTIVAGLASLVCLAVILFFLAFAWRRSRIAGQCGAVLHKSGLPCFAKGSKDIGDGDKGNRGNFYTVTPKLNGAANANGTNGGGSGGNGGEAAPEEVEAQQFFEHMISLQKNQDTLVANKRRNTLMNNSTANDQQETDKNQRPVAVARALSPYNHIYMEIDPTDATVVDGSASQPAVYEPLTHSETYMMSTVSDMSEDNHLSVGHAYNYSDVSRQSSSQSNRKSTNSCT